MMNCTLMDLDNHGYIFYSFRVPPYRAYTTTTMASATDIITYIGIPLAVLGALPILYTFVRSLLTLRSIRHTLSLNAHTPTHTTTRAALISSIIEVELP